MTTELAEQLADGSFSGDKLSHPLEYVAEGVWYCSHRAIDTGEIPIAWVNQYEQILNRAGYLKPSGPERWPANFADWEKLARLAYLTTLQPGANTGFDFAPAELYSAAIIRDVFNPFRRAPFQSHWRTSTVITFAQSMYESRDFAGMPVLADALEEAGCDQPDILAHCRGPGPHVRGCWVVDLVLGKA